MPLKPVAAALLILGCLALAQAAPAASQPGGLPVPAPEVVARSYQTDGERLAAFKILLDVLEIRVPSSTPGAVARRHEYQRAIAALDPPRGGDPEVFQAAHTLMLDDRFKLDVLARFAPAFAPAEARKVGIKREAQGAKSNVALYLIGVFLACGAALASAFVVMAIGRTLTPRGDVFTRQLPIQLPDALGLVRVVGQRFELNYDCGKVTAIVDLYDPDRPRGRRSDGMSMTQFSDGSYREVRTDWTDQETRPVAANRKSITFKTRDGRSGERRFELADYGWRVGQTVGFISFGHDILLGFNHASDEVSQTQEIGWISRVNESALRLLMIVVAVLALIVVGVICLKVFDPPNPMLAGAVVAWMLLMIVVSIPYIRFFGAMTRRLRVKQFESKWRPRLESFLREKQGAPRPPP